MQAAPESPEVFNADISIERYGDLYLASRPQVGALSVLDAAELIALHLFLHDPNNRNGIQSFFQSLGCGEESARNTELFVNDRIRDGWSRSCPPENSPQALQSIYFTVTRECDLACPYCYQGLRNRVKKEMSPQNASIALGKIAAFNPDCRIVVTGGEPFQHARIFEILDSVEERDLEFLLLSNGSQITDEVARDLSSYRHLIGIQLSLDGITEKTHAITRTRQNFAKVLAAIDNVVRYEIPFALAPTIHEENAHEIYEIAALAIRKGGWVSPNNLRVFPHDENKNTLTLRSETLHKVVTELSQRLTQEFGVELLNKRRENMERATGCSATEPNANFICGAGRSLLDIDWNGEVYPCHLLKDRRLVLGNVFAQSFDEIFKSVEDKGIRVPAHEIPKCGSCAFSSKCGGGCRAGAYFAYNSLAREDNLCEIHYSANLRRALTLHPNHGL